MQEILSAKSAILGGKGSFAAVGITANYLVNPQG